MVRRWGAGTPSRHSVQKAGAAGPVTETETAAADAARTAPVFLASISTILGAILFLRFGYAVGNVGLLGALLIILIGHPVTVPTALAIAEIATNRRVEGGGEYFIISRSFGTTIGGAIGICALPVPGDLRGLLHDRLRRGLPAPGRRGSRADRARLSTPASSRFPAPCSCSALVILRGAALGVKAL